MGNGRSTGDTTSILQMAGLVLVLALAWILWSGLYQPLVLGLGLFSCLLSAWLARRMGFFRHALPLRSLLRLPAYWWWLLREIVRSSIEVAGIVLNPALPVSPRLVRIDSGERSEAGTVILGNSITLSPGTVTIDVHEGQLLVHCLTDAGAKALEGEETRRRVAALGID